MGVDHLGHVHLKVRDINRSVDFYTATLGLDVRERAGQYAFLTLGEHHHDIALQEVGDDASSPGAGVGMYHAAFEVEDADRLRDVYRELRDRDVAVSPVDHGISKALYFEDPDGNGLEVYLDTRDEPGEEWEGRNSRFDPAALGE